MKFQKVDHSRTLVFKATCLGCNRTLRTDLEEVYADLEGKPFQSYYCKSCKVRIERSKQDGTPNKV